MTNDFTWHRVSEEEKEKISKKAKEIMDKYQITRNTLCNWVKKGLIKIDKTPSGRYIYFDKIKGKNEKIDN